MEEVIIGDKVKHFKGGEYIVTGLSRDVEDANIELVTYVSTDVSSDGKYPAWTSWTRKLSAFVEDVEPGVKRFEKIDNESVLLKPHKGVTIIIHPNDKDSIVDIAQRTIIKTMDNLDITKVEVCPFTDTVTTECVPGPIYKCLNCPLFIN